MPTPPKINNLFQQALQSLATEEFFTLLQTPQLHLEHIISQAQATPKDAWYEQERAEWVLLLTGTAQLQFAEGELVALQAGDYCLIPARCKHRVEASSSDARWLALHFQAEGDTC